MSRNYIGFEEIWKEAVSRQKKPKKAKPKNSRTLRQRLVSTLTILSILALLVIGLFSLAMTLLPQSFTASPLSYKTEMYYKDSTGQDVLMGVFYADNREELSTLEIPSQLRNAITAAEDTKFYEHGGVDYQAVVRAALSTILNQDFGSQGGSTITQQYVKNMLIVKALNIPDEKKSQEAYTAAIEDSIDRKIREARYAMGIEKTMTKDEILTGYVNVVGFGGNMYGFQVGAQHYFSKDVSALTLNEMATLVAIVNNPSVFRIDEPESETNGEANGYAVTKTRRDYVLKRMYEDGYITQVHYTRALASKIEPKITEFISGCINQDTAFFCDYTRNVMLKDERYGATEEERWNIFYKGGLRIYTTLDADLQKTAIDTMKLHVPFTSETLKIGSSIVSVENSTGRILAMTQNKIYSNDSALAEKDDSFTAVNYSTSRAYGGSSGFQAGSTFKLFTLLEWLKNGHKLYESVTGQSTVTSMTNTCDGTGLWEGFYTLGNHSEELGLDASFTAMTATTSSINTAYMAMASQLDLCLIAKQANDLGVERADDAPMFVDPPMVIGSNEVSPLAMTGAYAAVGNNGRFCTPTPIDSITKQDGTVVYYSTVSCKQVIDPEINKAALKALRNTMSWGTAGAGKPSDDTDMFGKTGTTDNAVDTWVVGGSSRVTTGVWVGNTIGKTTLWRLYANGGGAANYRFSLFKDVMTSANLKYVGVPFVDPEQEFLW